MPKPLEPPDYERCQADMPGNGPFTVGGPIGDPKNGYRTRCKNLPSVIATEKRPGEDGRIGSMSLCVDCIHKFIEMYGDDHATFTSTKEDPMDPDENLKELRELTANFEENDSQETYPSSRDAYRIVELIEALDEWIKKGGFLPAEWQAARDTKS